MSVQHIHIAAGMYRTIPYCNVPTVRAPASLATSATIGAAPDPVPPPMPAVTNTRSLPSTSLYVRTFMNICVRVCVCVCVCVYACVCVCVYVCMCVCV